jgi:DNA-binding transcriptional regulator LsrR (DeoR family)
MLEDENVAKNAVAEILGYMLDAAGNVVGSNDVYKQVLANTLTIEHPDWLRNFAKTWPVWLVAAGKYKSKAVHMALKTGLANTLIIDSEIADYLIEQVTP